MRSGRQGQPMGGVTRLVLGATRAFRESKPPASATILTFPKVAPRTLRFSRREWQALLALTYAVPGTEVDVTDDGGGEYASLGAVGFEEGAWWTVRVTTAGFDVVNFAGYRVARFAAIGPLVERMGPHLAYMAALTTARSGIEAVGGQAASPRPLTVVQPAP